MTNPVANVKYPNLPDSELHHVLKNRPGENNDPDHAGTGGSLSKDVEETIETTDGGTQIAEGLKRAISDNDD